MKSIDTQYKGLLVRDFAGKRVMVAKVRNSDAEIMTPVKTSLEDAYLETVAFAEAKRVAIA